MSLLQLMVMYNRTPQEKLIHSSMEPEIDLLTILVILHTLYFLYRMLDLVGIGLEYIFSTPGKAFQTTTVSDSQDKTLEMQKSEGTKMTKRKRENSTSRSRSRSRSRSKSGSQSPVDPPLVKRDGKIVSEKRRAIPRYVLDGSVSTRRFPKVKLSQPTTKGLGNPGNYCYRNAVLQALFHTPAFYRQLGKMHKDCDKQPDNCVTCAIQALAYTYWNVNNEGLLRARHTAFNTACVKNPPKLSPDLEQEFKNKGQADAFSFLFYLVKEQLYSTELETDDDSIRSVFDFVSVQTWQCAVCQEYTTKVPEEDSLGLSVPIAWKEDHERGSLTIDQCLETLFAPHEETRRCLSASCQERHKAIPNYSENGGYLRDKKGNTIREAYPGLERQVGRQMSRAPEILVIQLQRFTFGGVYEEVQIVNGKKKLISRLEELKTDEFVRLFEYLDMSPYVLRRTDDCLYRLDGVVAHSGATIGVGHYVAGVRSYDGFRFENVNDETVNREGEIVLTVTKDPAELLDPANHDEGTDAYVLIYSRL